MSGPTPPPYGAAPRPGDPYPAPPGAFPPPPGSPPARRRPSAWWFAVAVLVMVGSVVGGIAGIIFTAVGTFSTVGTVTADGSTQRIVTDAEREAMLWAIQGETESCSIRDSRTGEEVERDTVIVTYDKTTGGRSWSVVNRFAPGSGRLDITCDPGTSDVQVGPAVEFGRTAGGFALFASVIVIGGFLGLVMLIVVTILYVTGRPRDVPPPLPQP